jgi:hypothetical protein
MHYHDIAVDYMVGAILEGFDTMVHLTEENYPEMNICRHLLIADQNFICINLHCFFRIAWDQCFTYDKLFNLKFFYGDN